MARQAKKSENEAVINRKLDKFFACWDIYLDCKDTKTQINLLRYMRKHILNEVNP